MFDFVCAIDVWLLFVYMLPHSKRDKALRICLKDRNNIRKKIKMIITKCDNKNMIFYYVSFYA